MIAHSVGWGFPAAKGVGEFITVPDQPIRIKRYPNRRFYASHTSSYVSLADIEQLIRDGQDVEIVDNQTGEDLTRAVLVQMIAEKHPDKVAMFPAAMLHSMLRANDVMTTFLSDYFRNSLAYLDYLKQHGSSDSLTQPVHWMKAWLERWSGPSPVQGAEDPPQGKASGDAETVTERMAQLERRIAELEKEREERG